MNITPGVWVRQILANPSVSQGKYASVAPETLSFTESEYPHIHMHTRLNN
jgi:hypothetical protein